MLHRWQNPLPIADQLALFALKPLSAPAGPDLPPEWSAWLLARERLILTSMALVANQARHWHQLFPDSGLEDLISAGTIGLIHAIDLFDPSRDTSPSTYLSWKIRGAVQDVIRRDRTVVRNAEREPARQKRLSGRALTSILEPDSFRCLMSRVLTPLMVGVISARYGLDGNDPLDYGEIGRRFGFSRQRAQQVAGQAIERLRLPLARYVASGNLPADLPAPRQRAFGRARKVAS